MTAHSPRLTAQLARLHAAIQGRPLPEGPTAARAAPDVPPVPLLGPSRACGRPQEAPAPRVLPTFPNAGEIQGDRTLSRGAAKVWATLHRLAVDVARARGYRAVPDQVTFHLPAVTLAGVVEYTDRHLRNLAGELEAAGLLDCGGHAQQVGARNLYDGCLWAVKTLPEADAPRIRADEWRHNWRPDFRADVEGKSGAMREISELQTRQAGAEEKYHAAQRRAAVPDGVSPPAGPSSEMPAPKGLRAVAERIPGLIHTHAKHRAGEVGKLASAIAHALAEPERRRYWCREPYRALAAEIEGRAGLRALALQVERLAVDLREAPGVWKRPGAVLAARLRPA